MYKYQRLAVQRTKLRNPEHDQSQNEDQRSQTSPRSTAQLAPANDPAKIVSQDSILLNLNVLFVALAQTPPYSDLEVVTWEERS